ncbi:MAG: radical SAM protein [Novosphingobium sp.]|jgi:7-carboxy-7-deazaguanine synthase|nr:radical SAM protein [Novosphingobium sp.]
MKVNEIFTSIDGEVNNWGQGIMSTFIRLQGCNLKCSYCDTKYAQSTDQPYQSMSVKSIIEKIDSIGCKKITITGGEPFLQIEELQLLCRLLLIYNFNISIETNGSINIPAWAKTSDNISLVIDYKLEFADKMEINNFNMLCDRYWIKFIIGSDNDFYRALSIIDSFKRQGFFISGKPKIAFSPIFGKVEPKELVELIKINKKWDITLNLQLHKFIWEPQKRGV